MKKFHKFLSIFIIFIFSNAAYADEIKLYKAGTRVRFAVDTHCMNNETALRVVGKLKLCEETCKINTESLKKQHLLEMQALKAKLDLNTKSYESILEVKDNTINKIQEATLSELQNQKDNTWIVVTVSIAAGVVLGAAIAVGAIELSK